MESYFQAMPYDIQREIYNKVYEAHVEELNNEIQKLKQDDIKELNNEIQKLKQEIHILKRSCSKIFNKLKYENFTLRQRLEPYHGVSAYDKYDDYDYDYDYDRVSYNLYYDN